MIKAITLFIIIVLFHSLNSYSQDNPFTVKWDEGFKFESADKQFSLKFGGRIQNDWAFYSQEKAVDTTIGESINGTLFRRLRFYNSGKIYNNVEYKLQMDFANENDVLLNDVFIAITKIPFIGNIKVGHFKEPFSIEAITSSKYIYFMERSLASSIAPFRNAGVMLYDQIFDQRLSWAAGVFRDVDYYGRAVQTSEKYNLTARITAIPIYISEEDYRLLHLGAGFSNKSFKGTSYTLKSRPETNMTEYFVSAEVDSTNHVNQVGTELAFVYGPLSIQGEYNFSFSNSTDTLGNENTNDFSAFYIIASYFITGEHRNYLTTEAAFGRIKPNRNLGQDGGFGALELALRYSASDLDSKNVKGGQLFDLTVGLNWYLNSVTRISANYILGQLNDVGNINIFQMRFQLDF